MKTNLDLSIKKQYSSIKVKRFVIKSSSNDFKCNIPKEKKFKVENLFEFKRISGDLMLSSIALIFVIFLLLNFNLESGWNNRDLTQSRVGKILKQQWIGPLICMVILIPAVLLNFSQSIKQEIINKRLRLPNRIRYELMQWFKSLEFIIYFLIYTYVISILGYLLSTVIFSVFMTFRLGYRSFFWISSSLITSLCIVLIFRTILQIKTPVNIWLYKYFPEQIEIFMKIYF